MDKRPSKTFRKAVKIKRSQEISRLFKTGRRWDSDLFRICYLPNRTNRNRYAILVPGKSGNAVLRNKIKRAVREIFRNCLIKTPVSNDILIRINPKMASCAMRDLEGGLRKWYESLKK